MSRLLFLIPLLTKQYTNQAVWIGRHIPLFALQDLESLRQLPETKEVPAIRENVAN